MDEGSNAVGDLEDSGWTVKRFAEDLRELKRRAGAPPLSAIRKRIERLPGKHVPGIATLSALFNGTGTRAPDWDLVDAVVTALVAHAHDRGVELDEALGRSTEWKRRHEYLVRDLEGDKADQDARRKELLERHSVVSVQGNRFPRLDEVMADWHDRPKPAGGAYLPRPDFDEELRVVLAARSAPFPVLVVYGEDGVGKSTSAWAAVEEVLHPETKVLVARDGADIAALAESADALTLMTGPTLIWVDGLSAADLDCFTRATLDRLADTAVIVATMPANQCDAILDSPQDLMSTARDALRRAYFVHLPHDPEIAERLVAAGGTVLQPAGPQPDPRLVWLRLNSPNPRNAPGVAIVRSVIDCGRVGVTRPVSDDELKQLFPIYLAALDDVPASDELFAVGMAWAQHSGPDAPAPLRFRRHRARASWVVWDQLSGDQATWRKPDALWPSLIEMLDPQECFHLAREADKCGELIYAKEALIKAATLPDQSASASVLLAGLYRRIGDLSAAKNAFLTVIDLGPSDAASAAAQQLGHMFQDEGDIGRAIEYWTLATQWPGAFELMAWYELGRHYASVGDRERAAAALSRDFSKGLPGLALRASTMLSFVRGSIGDLQSLVQAWEADGDHRWENHDDALSALQEYVEVARSAEDSAHPPEAADPADIDAGLADGLTCRALGDLRGALRVFQAVAASGQPALRAAALCEAGSTAQEMGLLDEARTAYENAIRCAQPGTSGEAALSLGGMLWEARDIRGATEAWTKAVQLGEPEAQSKAAFNIGIAYHDAHDYDTAVSHFEHAMTLVDTGFRAKIAMMLAQTHQTMGTDAAIIDDYYRQAVDVGDPHFSPLAAVALGNRIYAREGASPEALSMTRTAYESQDLDARGEAAWRLGHMLEELEEFGEAITAYQTAIDSGHADWSPAGHCGLGLLHGTQNRTHMAMRHLRAAYNSGHSEYHLEAAYWMGMFYWWDGTHGQTGALRNAAIFLQEVVDSGHSKWAADAASALASIQAHGEP